MTLSLHTIAPKPGTRAKKFRVGRGPGSGRGKTAGRGTKGQRARSGGRKRLALKGMKQMLLSFPKMRGFQSRFEKPSTVSLEMLSAFEEGATVNMQTLKKHGLVNRASNYAKIVGGGELTKRLKIENIALTESAKAAVEKAGGKIVARTQPNIKKSKNGKK